MTVFSYSPQNASSVLVARLFKVWRHNGPLSVFYSYSYWSGLNSLTHLWDPNEAHGAVLLVRPAATCP